MFSHLAVQRESVTPPAIDRSYRVKTVLVESPQTTVRIIHLHLVGGLTPRGIVLRHRHLVHLAIGGLHEVELSRPRAQGVAQPPASARETLEAELELVSGHRGRSHRGRAPELLDQLLAGLD